MKKIAEAMSSCVGFIIDEKLIIKLPDDGCPGHLTLPHRDVYAARAGEFTVLAYAYDDGRITIHIV